jgi:hypothetical protein
VNKSKFRLNFLLLIIGIYLVSISQLYLLQIFPNLIAIKKSMNFMAIGYLWIGYLWIGGIFFDLISLLMFTLPSLVLKKHMSPLPIGIAFYMLSLPYGFLCIFLNYQLLPIPVQSLVKVFEFMLIISFHILCIWILPHWVDLYVQKSSKKL